MAIWQYTFQVIENKSLKDLSVDKIFIEDGYFNEEPYWVYSNKSKEMFYKIDTILRKNISWNSNIDLYGTQESHCSEVYFDEKERVISASFRIDFTQPYEYILKELIEFCILRGLVIIDEDLNSVPLNYECVNNVIKTSNQRKIYYNMME
ncbi:hypothetical protein PG357_04390 [Riemerella anatipestifer]|nr:hypothetical protein [Riemerella anatipestifer]MDY3351221.1 hypothetical protein [Riemerella anatipestifer]